ncbi:MAG: LysM peptidoglycan-binding domain-containing protein, partial [Lachnospiraceae bacterium]|nr:LysM peptidoglycan-binding domain-containing protein [Lachnospiraceae bacterium]
TGAKGNGTYIVKAGDTLTGISVRLGVTIQYLVDKNGIKNADYIIEGQEINY